MFDDYEDVPDEVRSTGGQLNKGTPMVCQRRGKTRLPNDVQALKTFLDSAILSSTVHLACK